MKVILRSKEGETKEYSIRYLKTASKGDTIFGTLSNWIIAVNVPWREVGSELQKNLGDLDFEEVKIYADEIKRNEERHFILVKVNRIERRYKATEIEEKPEGSVTYEYKGLKIYHGETRVIRRYVEIVDEWTPEERFKVKRRNVEREFSSIHDKTTFEVVDETEFTRLFKKANTLYVRDVLRGVFIAKSWKNNFIHHEPEIPEDKVLELSKYYVIAYPEIEAHLDRIYLFKFVIFYDGQKYEFNFTKIDDSEIPPPLYRIMLRRLALSKHYKRILWFGMHYTEEDNFYAFREDLLNLVNKLDEIKSRVKRVKELTSFERFLELFYIRTPKRKFKALEPYFELYDRLSEYIKDKPTMYVAFPNKYGRMGSNYPCIKVENGRYTIHSTPPAARTCFVFKGTFERAYRLVMNLNKLITFQYSKVGKKIEMLKKDVEELRKLFGNVEKLHPEKDIMAKLFDMAKDYSGDNLVLILYKARDLKNAPDYVTLLKLAGLIKSGKEYDFTPERLSDVLKALRIAVKYEIKSRDYSPKIGVILTGSPSEIASKVAKVVKELEGREAGLLKELLKEEAQVHVEVPVSSRVIRLLHDIES